jgi:regulatory protein
VPYYLITAIVPYLYPNSLFKTPMNPIYSIKEAIIRWSIIAPTRNAILKWNRNWEAWKWILKKLVVISHLINDNFINESRFACSFARGKHRIKNWGRVRIVNELKFRNITSYNINLALKEISAGRISDNVWYRFRETMGDNKRNEYAEERKKF